MAVEKGLTPLSWPASADLSTSQYRCVNFTAGDQIQRAGASAFVLGVLQNDPSNAGEAATVASWGVTKVHASTTGTTGITSGDALVTAANGIAVEESTGGTAYVWGRATSDLSSGSTGLISALITHEGPQSTA